MTVGLLATYNMIANIDEIQEGVVIKKKYKVIKKIGSGVYGIVIKVLNEQDGKHYAIKILKNSSRSKE